MGITMMKMIMITYYYYCYVGGVGTSAVGDSLIVIGLRYQLIRMMGGSGHTLTLTLALTHIHSHLHMHCINRCFEVQAITTTTTTIATTKLPTTVKCVGEQNNRLLPTHTHTGTHKRPCIHLHTHTFAHFYIYIGTAWVTTNFKLFTSAHCLLPSASTRLPYTALSCVPELPP